VYGLIKRQRSRLMFDSWFHKIWVCIEVVGVELCQRLWQSPW
jgi:hypothetical protein